MNNRRFFCIFAVAIINIMSRKLILISNDDGVAAPGLLRLIEAVSEMGEIVAVAPATPQSGKSSAMTVNDALRVNEHEAIQGTKLYSVTGTPVDCIKIALHHLVPRRPDLVIAGINHGSNAGVNVIYSGTMGAVLEGCMQGIPSVGFSLMHHSMSADFSMCLPWIKDIVSAILTNGLPHDVCLNVNFPAKVAVKGLKVARSARSHWSEEYATYTDPHGKPFYWLSGHLINEEPDNPDTDLYWLDRNYASVVPVHPSQDDTDSHTLIKEMLALS